MYERLINSVTEAKSLDESCVKYTVGKVQQLGQLVKEVNLSVKYTEYDEQHNYATMLSRLASMTPNVHTVEIPVPMVRSVMSGRSFDWSVLASQWTNLSSLTFNAPSPFSAAGYLYNLNNIHDVFNKLQHLDVSICSSLLKCMLPSVSAMPYLQSLMVKVGNEWDYQALRKILQACQNTLHTLIISFTSFYGNDSFDVDVDDLIMGQKHLKSLGMTTDKHSQISINQFGDNLEHLEWFSNSTKNDFTFDQSIIQAMMKTRSLKTLSLLGSMTLDHIPLILEANKNTLRTFYFLSPWEHEDFITHSLANNVRLCNVTTLYFESRFLKNSDVCSLAEIFPNVEFLGLSREMLLHNSEPSSRSTISKWITTAALSHFQRLKAIEKVTFLEIIDYSTATYRKCNIPWGQI
jgi:hypothetical protein